MIVTPVLVADTRCLTGEIGADLVRAAPRRGLFATNGVLWQRGPVRGGMGGHAGTVSPG